MPRGVEKSAFPHVMGGSVCLLWRAMGRTGKGEMVPTPGSGNSPSKCIPQFEKHRDMFGVVCKRIKIWKKAKCLSIGYIRIYLHNGILHSHYNE